MLVRFLLLKQKKERNKPKPSWPVTYDRVVMMSMFQFSKEDQKLSEKLLCILYYNVFLIPFLLIGP